MRYLVLTIFILISAQVQALTVLSINTENFWDEHAPHEGRIGASIRNQISSAQVEAEAKSIAEVIIKHDADIVGLIEVEGLAVVKRILSYLPNEWSIAFKKGRDTYTGQDVALLTRLGVLKHTVSTFPSIKGRYGRVNVRPSKVLGVGLVASSGERIYVAVTHLISKRRNNDDKRAAQANAVARAVVNHGAKYRHRIVMGDLNDTPGSQTLNQLTDSGLIQVPNKRAYSYIYRNKRMLIDHILISPSLIKDARFSAFDISEFSDHRAVKLILP